MAFVVLFLVKIKGKNIESKIVNIISFVTVEKFSKTSALFIGWMTVQRTQLVASISSKSITEMIKTTRFTSIVLDKTSE